MKDYFRPILRAAQDKPANGVTLAGGWTAFSEVEVLRRGKNPQTVSIKDVPRDVLARLTQSRQPICDLSWDRPAVMGILNVTPDSFSDGGKHATVEAALAGARHMSRAHMIDVGGESTRPGATRVPEDAEIARTAPVISRLRAEGIDTPISIDTRKAPVARSALEAGASLVNDVSGFTFDQDLPSLCAKTGVPICIMHALGDPATMQNEPRYDDVVLDVYDFLEGRIEALSAQGISREKMIVDPGIGFGKTLDHNLQLLRRLSVFHSLGVPVLLGVSRKRFIGTIGRAEAATDRLPGSLAVALAALNQGVQILRVHDVPETLQAIALWEAVMAGTWHG